MQDKRKEMDNSLTKWRSAFRGHIYLGTILPLLFVCAGYLQADLKTVCRLIIGSFLMLNLFILYWRRDAIVQAMKAQGTFSKRCLWKRILVKVLFIALAGLLVFLMINPLIPIWGPGILASLYYLAAMLVWYQSIKGQKKE